MDSENGALVADLPVTSKKVDAATRNVVGIESYSNKQEGPDEQEKEMESSGTDREDREVIIGSAPLASAFEATSDLLAFNPLVFDAGKYLAYVEDEGLTEAQAIALLGAYWNVYVAFVDAAFGIHSVQQAVDGLFNAAASPAMAKASVLQSTTQPNKPGNIQAARPR